MQFLVELTWWFLWIFVIANAVSCFVKNDVQRPVLNLFIIEKHLLHLLEVTGTCNKFEVRQISLRNNSLRSKFSNANDNIDGLLFSV